MQIHWLSAFCSAALALSVQVVTAHTPPDDARVFFGFGYHGNGVNTATWTGQQLAEWTVKGRQPEGLPAAISGLNRRYPFPALRRSFLRFALFTARQLDRFG